MKNTNKPQWLIDAEKDINEFHETEYGKLSDKEFRFKERQSEAAKMSGLSHIKNNTGFFKINDEAKFTARSKGGITSGNNNVQNGHFSRCQTIATIVAGKKRKELTLKRRLIVLKEISNDWIKRSETCKWFESSKYSKEWGIKGQFISDLLADTNFFETKGEYKNKLYRKIK